MSSNVRNSWHPAEVVEGISDAAEDDEEAAGALAEPEAEAETETEPDEDWTREQDDEDQQRFPSYDVTTRRESRGAGQLGFGGGRRRNTSVVLRRRKSRTTAPPRPECRLHALGRDSDQESAARGTLEGNTDGAEAGRQASMGHGSRGDPCPPPPPPPRRLPSGRVGEGPAGAPRPSRQLPGCEKKEGEAEEKEGGGAFASHPGSSPPPRLFPRTFLTSALPLPCVMGPSRSPEPLLPVRTHHHHRQKGMAEERPRTRSASLLASIAPLLAPAPSPVPLRGEGEGEASFSLSLGARALHLLLVFA